MPNHKTRFYYECTDCKAKVPVTDADPDPVLMVPGDRKFEWVFVCRGCAPSTELGPGSAEGRESPACKTPSKSDSPSM